MLEQMVPGSGARAQRTGHRRRVATLRAVRALDGNGPGSEEVSGGPGTSGDGLAWAEAHRPYDRGLACG